MKRYRCHKIVEAARILRVTGTTGGFNLDLGPDGTQFVDFNWWTRTNLGANPPSHPDGYFVRYADGYTSFSPAQTFEEGYTAVEEPP